MEEFIPMRQLYLLGLVCLLLQGVAAPQTPASKNGILDEATLTRFRNSAAEPAVLLDLNLARVKPDLVTNDQPFLNYFIMLNNCGNMAKLHSLTSEFDYPSMAAFYKSHAAEILAPLSLSVGMMSPQLFLGEYDPARHAFPFVGYMRPGAPAKPANLDGISVGNRVGLPCQNALQVATAVRTTNLKSVSVLSNLGPFYTIHFKENSQFAELPMDEVHAREYVEGLRGGGRMISLLVDFDILPEPPTIAIKSGAAYITFEGKIKRVRAAKSAMPNVVLGTLYPREGR